MPDDIKPDPKAEQGKHEKDDSPEPTHHLHLADGSVVDHFGAIPTHVAVGDTTVPVVNAFER